MEYALMAVIYPDFQDSPVRTILARFADFEAMVQYTETNEAKELAARAGDPWTLVAPTAFDYLELPQ
jgi:hypothetical protein